MSDNRPIDWANGERVGDPGKLSRHGHFPGHAGSYSDNVIGTAMKCCDGNCVRRWPLTSFGSYRRAFYRPGPYPHTPLPYDKGKGVCVRDVCAIYDNNISPSLLMIIIKIIILYFIQIRQTGAFPPTGTLLVLIIPEFTLLYINYCMTGHELLKPVISVKL